MSSSVLTPQSILAFQGLVSEAGNNNKKTLMGTKKIVGQIIKGALTQILNVAVPKQTASEHANCVARHPATLHVKMQDSCTGKYPCATADFILQTLVYVT